MTTELTRMLWRHMSSMTTESSSIPHSLTCPVLLPVPFSCAAIAVCRAGRLLGNQDCHCHEHRKTKLIYIYAPPRFKRIEWASVCLQMLSRIW